MELTKTNVREGTVLNLQQTHTTREGFTTLAKTGNKDIDLALTYFEDGLSGAYYYTLNNDRVGEDPLGFAIAYLEQGLEILKGE